MATTQQRHPVEPRTTTVETAALVWSVLAALAGAWWLVDPERYPMGADLGSMSLVAQVPASVAAAALVVLGLAGAVVAGLLRTRMALAAGQRLLVTVAVVEVLVFAVVAPDTRVLIGLGYLTALAGPVVVLALLVLGARRSAAARAAVGVVAVGVLAMAGAIGAEADTVIELGRELAGGFGENGPGIVAVTAGFAGGVLWLVLLVRLLRRRRNSCASCGRPAPARLNPEAVQRWGRRATVLAVLCPLPYGLMRMTWLTPWPLGFDADALEAQPELRMFGIGLGIAALGGSILTLGLVQRWGERFPGWIPGLRGRPVPVLPPTVAALVIAGAITIAARSLTQSLVMGEAPELPVAESLLVFPFPVWGPTLGFAAVAYYLRRRGRCDHCGRD